MAFSNIEKVIEGFNDAGVTYGDHISHGDISAWAGLDFPDLEGIPRDEQKKAVDTYQLEQLAIVDGLKKYLLEQRFMYLESVRGSGYRVVKPGEQTEAAVREGMKKIQKGLDHAQRGVQQVNLALLTSEEREFNASVKARLSGLARLIGRKRDYLNSP